MPGVLETGVSPPVLVETLWTSARGAIRHPSLRFGMSIIPTSSPRASRHLSRRFRRPSRYSRFISRHSCPLRSFPRKRESTAADAPHLNPEPIYRMTYVSLRRRPFRPCCRQLLERRDPSRAAPRVGGVARIPLPALGSPSDPGTTFPSSPICCSAGGAGIARNPYPCATQLWRQRPYSSWGRRLTSSG